MIRLAILLAFAGFATAETKDLIYVSGKSSGAGGAREQTKRALRATGLKPKAVLNTTAYITDAKHLPEVDLGYRDFFGKEFPTRTVLVAELLTPGALVEISANGTRNPAARRLIRNAYPESAAAECGGVLFLSALHAPQPEQVMKEQEAVLQAAGFTFADLVLTKIYLAEPTAYTELNEVYKRLVTAPPPARATIHAAPLRPGELLQIQSIAVRGSGEGRPSGKGHTSPIHSFSVKAGRRLYITGMTGRAPAGQLQPEIQAQARQSLATIAEQLERNGMGFADVVETTVWLQKLHDFEAMRALLPANGARTVVQIPPSSKEALVEIQMVAEATHRPK